MDDAMTDDIRDLERAAREAPSDTVAAERLHTARERAGDPRMQIARLIGCIEQIADSTWPTPRGWVSPWNRGCGRDPVSGFKWLYPRRKWGSVSMRTRRRVGAAPWLVRSMAALALRRRPWGGMRGPDWQGPAVNAPDQWFEEDVVIPGWTVSPITSFAIDA